MPAGTGPVTLANRSANDPLHERIAVDVALAIVNLNLSGVSQGGSIGGNVYVKLSPDETDVSLPACLVILDGEEDILQEDGDFEQRAWGYPVGILIVDSASIIDPKMRPDFVSWRHDVMAWFDDAPAKAYQLFPNVVEAY